jgi:hypothetical protein
MIPHDRAPDYTRGFLRVPLDLWAALYCRAPLTRRQLQLVSVVLRESWGWQRKGGQVQLWTRPLSPSQFAQLTGLSTDRLSQDLQALIERGVLREDAQRYQLLPHPQLWITPHSQAPKQRQEAPKPPALTAKTALTTPDVKKKNIKQRNVSLPVDNSRSQLTAPRSPEPFLDRAALPEQFCQVLAAFAGDLTDTETEALRTWIKQAGIAAVWKTVGPMFRSGPAELRARLRHRLRATPRPAE